MLRIQAPAIITQCENIVTWYVPNLLLHSSLRSTRTCVRFRGLHQQQNGDKTERKTSWLYCSRATPTLLHRPEHSIGTLFHAKSKWKAQQKQIIHDFTKGDNNNYGSQNSSPFIVFPLPCVYISFSRQLGFKPNTFVLVFARFHFRCWDDLLRAMQQQREQPTSRQICAKSTSFPWSHFFLL